MSRLTTLTAYETVCATFATAYHCQSCRWYVKPFCEAPMGMHGVQWVIQNVTTK